PLYGRDLVVAEARPRVALAKHRSLVLARSRLGSAVREVAPEALAREVLGASGESHVLVEGHPLGEALGSDDAHLLPPVGWVMASSPVRTAAAAALCTPGRSPRARPSHALRRRAGRVVDRPGGCAERAPGRRPSGRAW